MKNYQSLFALFLSFSVSISMIAQEKEGLEKEIPKSQFKGVDLISIDDPEPIDSKPNITTFTNKWLGVNNSTGIIYRTGIVGVGLTNPPTDTRFYVKADNLKVGIVSEVNHSIDYQFGILSAVNRSNTKALSVLLKENGNYVDKFVVMGSGNVLATEVRVQTELFPDYVFGNNYDLMPLSEVDRFIKKNKHLPNIPKAEKIIEEGLELGNMQVKQMEKIEELFLHIIKLEKRIKNLEKNLKESNQTNDVE